MFQKGVAAYVIEATGQSQSSSCRNAKNDVPQQEEAFANSMFGNFAMEKIGEIMLETFSFVDKE